MSCCRARAVLHTCRLRLLHARLGGGRAGCQRGKAQGLDFPSHAAHGMAQASSLLLACAPGDGIGPCALLGACVRTPQLLVNVPEGFARLVLEHRVRPSAKLAAVVLTHLRPEAAVRASRV